MIQKQKIIKRYICSCGSILTSQNKRHFKTTKHLQFDGLLNV